MDILVPTLYYLAATQIRILKNTLQCLGQRVDDKIQQHSNLSSNELSQLRSNIIYKEICHCIQHYDAIATYLVLKIPLI